MFCQNTNATALNFYSKNNLVREKRNITSLYSLIEKSPEHSKTIVENFSFRITLPRDNGLHRNESTKQLNASSSLKYFHLSGLHEYEQIDILKEAHMDTLSRNHSAKSIASRCSYSQGERWKRRALKNCYREEEEDHRGLGLRQNESQSEGLEELAESVFRDGQIPEEMKAESVVIDKIGLSTVQKITNPEFFSHEPTPISHLEPYPQPKKQLQPQRSTPQSKIMIPPEPLQPQISSSVLTSNPIHSTIIQTSEIQIPDKLSTIQADMQYDQKDFFDLADSPIELLKADTNRQTKCISLLFSKDITILALNYHQFSQAFRAITQCSPQFSNISMNERSNLQRSRVSGSETRGKIHHQSFEDKAWQRNWN